MVAFHAHRAMSSTRVARCVPRALRDVFHARRAMTNPGYWVHAPGTAVIGSIVPFVTRTNTNPP